MTSRERMDRAMAPAGGRLPDRVPVMCQLALGHYFLETGLDPVDIWHDTIAFGEALVMLQRRYGFDGILVNLPGRDPEWRRLVSRIERAPDGAVTVRWSTGRYTIVPADDNPHVHLASTDARPIVPFDALEPECLFYVEPHGVGGASDPARWAFETTPIPPGPGFFPPWHWDTIKYVRAKAPDVSVHGEVFSPFTQLLELVGYEPGLVAMMTQPAKFAECLARLVEGTVVLACGHFEAGVDAVLVSSAFAGAGFLSPAQYRVFVLPCERAVITRVRARFPDKPLYTHTCGAIGDRLELMLETGTRGIDTLDPPPLGTVDLSDAKRRLGQRAFIKGNVDPVNTLLRGTPGLVYEDALARLAIGMPGGGYILSTACSVAPHTPPENILKLADAAEDAGWYR